MSVEALVFWGVDLRDLGNGQLVGDCPFCNCDSKFMAGKENGLWDCKICAREGNIISFLSRLHEHSLTETTLRDYKDLSEYKKVPVTLLQEFKVAKSVLDPKEWMIAYSNSKTGNVTNLKKLTLDKRKKKSPLYSTAGLKQDSMFNFERFSIKRSKVIVCEGEWDTMIMQGMINNLGPAGKMYSVVGAPGAGIFKDHWVSYFRDKEVYLAYDHDEAGYRGVKKVSEKLARVAKSISFLNWRNPPLSKDSEEEGYDIKDYYNHGGDWPELKLQFQAYKEKVLGHSGGRATFPEVVEHFSKHVLVTENVRQGMAICYATILSRVFSGDNPIWMLLVGEPGCGKTMVMRSAAQCESVVYMSNLTSTNLISGAKTKDDSDPSLLNQLKGKVLILKDYTEILSLSDSAKTQLVGTMRGIFDGEAERHYGTGVSRKYPDCAFPLLAGVTPVIHYKQHAVTAMGERYLRFDFMKDKSDAGRIVEASLKSGDVKLSKVMAPIINGFIDREYTLDDLPKATPRLLEQCWHIGNILGSLRTTSIIKEEDTDGYAFGEVGTRPAMQLRNLARCLAYVLEKKEIDDEVHSLINTITLDTCIPKHVRIISCLSKDPGKEISEISRETKINRQEINRRMVLLESLQVVERDPEWKLTSSFEESWGKI
jgi:hypothetical protein